MIIPLAYLLDLLLGDPRWLPHPVRWIGRYITFLEDRIRLFTRTSKVEKVGGVLLFTTVVGTVYSLTWSFLYLVSYLSPFTFHLFAVFIAYATLSIKSLHQEATGVIEALKNPPPPLPSPRHLMGEGGHLDEARKRLSNIVGRDTHNLSEEEIYRAVTETVAENTSDGIIAPLFYLAIGGPALAITYKAINTLDSMVGHKDERYRDLGWFSARMDDIANLVPARVTALLMTISAFILRLDWKNSIRILWRDARNHPSPNAGYPEAAVAGALGVRLGGINYYEGISQERPFIGEMKKGFSNETVYAVIKVMQVTALLGVVVAILIQIGL